MVSTMDLTEDVVEHDIRDSGHRKPASETDWFSRRPSVERVRVAAAQYAVAGLHARVEGAEAAAHNGRAIRQVA